MDLAAGLLVRVRVNASAAAVVAALHAFQTSSALWNNLELVASINPLKAPFIIFQAVHLMSWHSGLYGHSLCRA
jgi:hypothetical protein